MNPNSLKVSAYLLQIMIFLGGTDASFSGLGEVFGAGRPSRRLLGADCFALTQSWKRCLFVDLTVLQSILISLLHKVNYFLR